MSTKIKIEKFDPISVKVIGKKKVEIKFFDLDLPNRKQTGDDSNLPHQDLLNCLAEFGEDMARALGLLDGWDCARDEIKGNLDGTKKAKEGYEKTVLNCTVDAISFFGDTRESIELSGPVITKTGSRKQTTPRISLNPDNNENAKDAIFKIDELKKELWAYLFGDKYIKTEKKKKKEANEKAVDTFEKAIDAGGVFPIGENV